MQSQKVQEYTTETGPSGLPIARLGAVHNLITFVRGGSEKIHFFDGQWKDDGGNLLDPDSVPTDLKEQAAAIPFKPHFGSQEQVLINCEFCTEVVASGEYARHLTDKHIRGAVKTPRDPETPSIDGPVDPTQRKLKPEDLPPGNYVLDDEGNVVLNLDGSPRKKAGRPRTDAQE
jgi:hypothetical protein